MFAAGVTLMTLHWWRHTDVCCWRYTDDVTLMTSHWCLLLTLHWWRHTLMLHLCLLRSCCFCLPAVMLFIRALQELPQSCRPLTRHRVSFSIALRLDWIASWFPFALIGSHLACIAPWLDCILLALRLELTASWLHNALIGLHLACIVPWIDCILIALCLDWIASCLHCALIGSHLDWIASWLDRAVQDVMHLDWIATPLHCW